MSKFKKALQVTGALAVVTLTNLQVAQASSNPVPTISIAGSGSGAISIQSLWRGLVGSAVNIILAVAAVIALLYLIWAGIKYITAGGDAKKAGEARTGIINAIIGIVIIVLAFFIIRVAFGVGQAVESTGNGNAITL